MDRQELIERLAGLTGGLRVSRGVPPEDLREVRRLLAASLRAGRPFAESFELDSTSRAAPAGRAARVRRRTEVEPFGLSDRVDVSELGEPLVRELESAAEEAEHAADVRISRRTVPFLTSAEFGSIPAWAGGQHIERTLGPFLDAVGRPVWFDIIIPVRQVSVVRAPSTNPFLLIPLRGLVLGSSMEYAIPAGSVWIAGQTLTPTAPVGSYAGVRVKGGRLKLTSPATAAGNTLTVAAGVQATLELELDPPASSAPAPEPGEDGRAAKVVTPGRVAFEFTTAGGTLAKADDAAVKVIGGATKLTRANAPASFAPLLNRILLPFTPDTRLFAAASAGKLVRLSGRADILGGAWALAIAVTPPADLGAAAGVGGLTLRLSNGLRVGWRGLTGGELALGEALVMAEIDRAVLAGAAARGPGIRQTLRLWDDDAGSSSQVMLTYAAPAPLRYISLAGNADAIVVSGALEAAADRPVRADGRRLPLRSDTAVAAFIRNASGDPVLVRAGLTGTTERPIAIALSNGLFTVSPPQILFLAGETSDGAAVKDGTFSLLFQALGLMMTLRDPYVSNQPLPRPRDGPLSHNFTGPRLNATVTWTDPSSSKLQLTLETSATTSVSPILATGTASSPSASAAPLFFAVAQPRGEGRPPDPGQARAEDEQAAAALHSIFTKAAGSLSPQLVLLDVSSNINQLGVGFGFRGRDDVAGQSGLPFGIDGIDLVAPGRNVRLFLLPQFQWEPVTNIPNPELGFFPPRLFSADDGGPTVLGSNSVHLVPIAPDRVAEQLVARFLPSPMGEGAGALFTLPFGIKAAAVLRPRQLGAVKWAELSFVRPETARFRGGYQLSVVAGQASAGPSIESPSLQGAAWQTRNGVDPLTLAPNGFSVLRGDLFNEGVEKFFNDEMKPGGTNPRVPVTRIDLSGYGASTFSRWGNPNAVAEISQVRFDAFVGRTAYEVVQVASVLYCCAAPVVRTITFERRKEGVVLRADSGWVATAPGLYRYPTPNPTATLPPDWSPIESHPGVVRGAHNIRNIRETGRVVVRDFGAEHIELLEVRFDADFEIENVVVGQDPGHGRVPGLDQIGFVQRSPKGYPLVPAHLAAILATEGPAGGPVDCVVAVGGSRQRMHVVRVDVGPSHPLPPGVPEFAAAARGALELPADGEWTVVRRPAGVEEAGPVDPVAGVPLIRQGRASAPGSASPWYRFADANDLLRESNPDAEFSLLQGSEAHQVLFPRPRVGVGAAVVSSTERPLLADAYARATSTGLFPKRSACFEGPGPYQLDINPQGRYTLAPGGPVPFTNIAGGERSLFDSEALAIRTRYGGPIRFTLDPTQPRAWAVEIDDVLTAMDLGPFDELMGVRHAYRAGAGERPRLERPEMVYAPFLAPVVAIVRFLSELLGIDNAFDVSAVSGSWKFQAFLKIPIENSATADQYLDFGFMKVKGEVKSGFGWSKKDKWFGFFEAKLGLKVPVLPPILGSGKTVLKLKSAEVGGDKLTIQVLWGASVGTTLGPLKVSAEFHYGIEVIVATGGAWQIGLMVEVVGTADVFIAKVSIRLGLLAAIGRKPAPDDKVEAIGQVKFAAEITLCWVLTISYECDIEYREELSI